MPAWHLPGARQPVLGAGYPAGSISGSGLAAIDNGGEKISKRVLKTNKNRTFFIQFWQLILPSLTHKIRDIERCFAFRYIEQHPIGAVT
jgi:hypothetical protein